MSDPLCSSQHAAVSSPFVKRKPVAELLVRRGAALNEKNKELLTPLHVAADCNHADSVELLLKHGAKVNALDSHGQTGQSWGRGGSVLRAGRQWTRAALNQLPGGTLRPNKCGGGV